MIGTDLLVVFAFTLNGFSSNEMENPSIKCLQTPHLCSLHFITLKASSGRFLDFAFVSKRFRLTGWCVLLVNTLFLKTVYIPLVLCKICLCFFVVEHFWIERVERVDTYRIISYSFIFLGFLNIYLINFLFQLCLHQGIMHIFAYLSRNQLI